MRFKKENVSKWDGFKTKQADRQDTAAYKLNVERSRPARFRNILGLMSMLVVLNGCTNGFKALLSPNANLVASSSTSPTAIAGSLATDGTPDVLTQHNDLARTGTQLNETQLNVSNVNSNSFGALFRMNVDGQVYAQPLYVSNVPYDSGNHNVVVIATMNNSIWTYDADTGQPLTNRHFGTPVNATAYANYHDIAGTIGILSTPVIDKASMTVYFVEVTTDGGGYHHLLHALDLKDASDRPGSPVEITGNVPGTGAGAVNGTVSFDSYLNLQRPSLALINGFIYVAFASHGDFGLYHGWMFTYRATDLAKIGTYCASPNSQAAGIWQSGQAPAADDQGNVYVVTGNGEGSDGTQLTERTESVLKFAPANGALNLTDYFTPFDWKYLDDTDQDLGVSGTIVIPNSPYVLAGSKTGAIYVMNRGGLGHISDQDKAIVQRFQATGGGHIHGTMIYWQGPSQANLYVLGEGDHLKGFNFTPPNISATPFSESVITAPPNSMPGGILSLSANGSQTGTGVIWANMVLNGNANQDTRPGILRAFNAEDLSQELWNSEQNPGRDSLGNFAKFVPPTIANGKVYMATFSNQVIAYGMGAPSPTAYAPTQNDPALTSPSVFDPNWYLNNNPDILASLGAGNTAAATQHWVSFGIAEGRQGNAIFKASDYLAIYPDLAASLGPVNYVGAVRHFVAWGVNEGRIGIFPGPGNNEIHVYRFWKNGDRMITNSLAEGLGAGYTPESSFLFYQTAVPATDMTAIYRCFSPGGHYFSVLANCEGFTTESIVGYLRQSQVPGTVPIYRLWNSTDGDHIMSYDKAEGAAVGFIYESTIGYGPAQ